MSRFKQILENLTVDGQKGAHQKHRYHCNIIMENQCLADSSAGAGSLLMKMAGMGMGADDLRRSRTQDDNVNSLDQTVQKLNILMS